MEKMFPINLRASRFGVVLAGGVFALLLHGASLAGRRGGAAPQAGPGPGTTAFYTARVQPIFQGNCYRCHSGFNHRGGLRLDSRAALMHGGHDGAVIVPGHPEQSLLIKLIRHEGPPNDPMPMPPKAKLSDADISIVEQWVRSGAAMPADTAPNQ